MDGGANDIYAQRYDADGVAQGSKFMVNTYTNKAQTTPSITALNNGGFVVTWDSYNQNISHDIYAQRYDAEGKPAGDLTLTGGANDDHIIVDALLNKPVELHGLEGNDELRGGSSDDTLFGGIGNETLDGGAGNDILYGDTGIDTARYLTTSYSDVEIIKVDKDGNHLPKGHVRIADLINGTEDELVDMELATFADGTKIALGPALVLDFSNPIPHNFHVVPVFDPSINLWKESIVQGQGSMSLGNFTDTQKNEILKGVQDVFDRSGINILVVDSIPTIGSFSTVQFSPALPSYDHDGNSTTPKVLLEGQAYEGLDRFNNDNNNIVAVFMDGPDTSSIVETVAHEAAHSFGARHINPVPGTSSEVMDYQPSSSPQFWNQVTAVVEPPSDGELPTAVTHNPTYHLRRYVVGESDADLKAEGILPGSWDTGLFTLFGYTLSFASLTAPINHLSIVFLPESSSAESDVNDAFGGLQLLADTINADDTINFSVPGGQRFQILASSSDPNIMDVAIKFEGITADSFVVEGGSRRDLTGTMLSRQSPDDEPILIGSITASITQETVIDSSNTSAGNHAPILITSLENQAVKYDTVGWSYDASASFSDEDVSDSLSYSATLANGNPLPAWILIGATTGVLTGSPSINDRGTFSLIVKTSDTHGSSVSAPLTVAATVFDAGTLLMNTASNDILAGTIANDSVTYAYATSSVTVSLATTTQQNTLGAGLDTLTNIDNLIGSDFNDILTGNSKNNALDGGAGNDTLNGGAGADTMIGGLGNDIFVVNHAGDVVIEYLNEGTDKVSSNVAYTLSPNIENLTLTGALAINGTGNDLANTLIGNAAANHLDGGTGADALKGGAGDDTYIVDNVGDVITENSGAGTDTVNSSDTYKLSGNVENLTLMGALAINGTGNILANTITGNSANNILNGAAGADTLIGGAGNDTYTVDNTGDVVTENLSEGTDKVNSSVTYTLSANVENLTLTGTSAINGTGNELANGITGNTAANQLDGGTGNDTLDGGLGNNVLTGGVGNDSFRFTTNGHVDTITDYNVVNDTVKLENAVFTALTTTGTLAASKFRIGTNALDADDFIIYNDTIGALLYDVDGSGLGAAVQIASLTGGLAMTNADIVVI